MIQIKTDLHVHSIFTDHAYSTIQENVTYAKSKGIELIAITDHFGPMFISEPRLGLFHFINQTILPNEIDGVRVFKGVEMDIVDHKGNLAFMNERYSETDEFSVGERVLKSAEFVIASVHMNPVFQPSTKVRHTEMYINAIRNPYVNMIGHIGRSGMEFEINEVLRVAKQENKIIEINNHSFRKDPENLICRKIAERCAEFEIPIAVNSDAHFSQYIGNYEYAIDMLEEIHFPEELIVNRTKESILEYMKYAE